MATFWFIFITVKCNYTTTNISPRSQIILADQTLLSLPYLCNMNLSDCQNSELHINYFTTFNTPTYMYYEVCNCTIDRIIIRETICWPRLRGGGSGHSSSQGLAIDFFTTNKHLLMSMVTDGVMKDLHI